MKHSITIIIFAIIFAIIFLITQNSVFAQLTYSEGGVSVIDPGLEVSPELRRYVDAVMGSDANDGKTQATAWKSLSKVNSEKGTYTPGFHILFKRGQSWSGNLGIKTNPSGAENNRIVFGAYGSLNEARPRISGTVYAATYYMVRDLQASRFYMGTNGNHHSIFYNNICFGGGNNGIMVIGDAHHSAIVGNIIYDVDNNDAISVHVRNWVTPVENVKSHHWILDNIAIGNRGMEDGVDVAMGDYTMEGKQVEGDVKVIANRIQMESVPGLSTRAGTGRQSIAMGHEAQYNWVIGNIATSGTSVGLNAHEARVDFSVRGNIFFKGGISNMCVLNAPNLTFENNTIYDYTGSSTPIMLDSKKMVFLNNLVLRPEGGYWAQKLIAPIEMDYNWWGHSESSLIDGKSLVDWQKATGFDLNSGVGDVPGVTAPPNDAYNHDPRNWNDDAFISQFIPSSEFTGNNGIIPGAFDNKGNRQGTAILPFEDSDLENGGLGWEGPPLVQQRLKELGISWGEPLLAKYPTPKDRSTNVLINSKLSWTAGDSTISHDLYLGTKSDSLIFISNQETKNYDPDTLNYGTVYYWRVDQVTNDSTVTGLLWSFTTEEEPIPPTLAENPKPADGSVDERTSLLLKWDPGKRTKSVKIYFGTVIPPPLILSQEGNIYNLSGLKLNTKYYWRIDGVNEWGETKGTTWQFTTKTEADLPEGWVGLDIGKVTKSGDDSFENNRFTLTASGKGIQDQADQFRYVSHKLSGDGEIIARVVSIDNTNPSAMAGVMIRGQLDSVSNYSLSALTPKSVMRAQWRLFESGLTNSKIGSAVGAPYWVKLVRAGNYVVSYESADGKTWKVLKTEQITMTSNIYMGMVVTSGDNDSICTAVFDNLMINGVLVSVEDENKENRIPKEFSIGNYPNPFNPETTIRYNLPKVGEVKVQVYNIVGSLVVELVNGKRNAGSHNVTWNGKNSQGVQTSSGIYLYRVQFEDQIKAAKMILLK